MNRNKAAGIRGFRLTGDGFRKVKRWIIKNLRLMVKPYAVKVR